MRYIKSKKLYACVMFAKKMINQYSNGTQDLEKIKKIATDYYGYKKGRIDEFFPEKVIMEENPEIYMRKCEPCEWDPWYGWIAQHDIVCWSQVGKRYVTYQHNLNYMMLNDFTITENGNLYCVNI